MRNRPAHVLLIVCFALAFPFVAQAAPSPVSVPDGTKVGTLKYGDSETEVTLPAAEQVAFLFVYGIWGLEQDCLSKDSGVGRLCSIAELVKGVKAASGEIFGLTISPLKDTNYIYDAILIGGDCVIRAIPRGKGLSAFAMVGSANRSSGSFWYSPNSPDLLKAVKLTEYGYEGSGFRR